MAACALATWAPSTSAGGVISVQPDGKILVAGGSDPGFGMLARLDPNGSLDSSFGRDGIAIDHGSVPFEELVVQPDGKVVAVNGWERLSRYEADGRRDFGFGEDGTVARSGSVEGPVAVVLLPDGRIALGGSYHVKMLTHQALAFVYAADGRSVEQVGNIGPPMERAWEGGPAGSLTALASRGDGSLLMAGFNSPSFQSSQGTRSVLARFVPGAGSPYDPAFGGGAGLVTVPYPGSLPTLNALVPTPEKIYATGTAARHIVAARFSSEGQLDPGFGSGGFADATPQPDFSQGNDLAIQPDGKVVVAGEVSEKSGWSGYACTECHPVVARFLPDGSRDPSFGSGGIARLSRADGSAPRGALETVVVLADGRILVAGRQSSRRPRVLVTRLMPNGEVDASFGQGGTTTIDACPGRPVAQRRSGCLPSMRAQLRVRRLPGRRVSFRLNVRPNLDWARVKGISLTLSDQLRVIEERRQRIRTTLVEEDGSRRSTRVALDGRELSGHWTIGPRSVSLSVPANALRWVGKKPPRGRLLFRVRVDFGTRFFEYPFAGRHQVVLRRALG